MQSDSLAKKTKPKRPGSRRQLLMRSNPLLTHRRIGGTKLKGKGDPKARLPYDGPRYRDTPQIILNQNHRDMLPRLLRAGRGGRLKLNKVVSGYVALPLSYSARLAGFEPAYTA